MKKIWNFIEHNRFTVAMHVVAVLVWFTAAGCTPVTTSPIEAGKQVNARQLGIEYEKWLAQQRITEKEFEAAGEDIAEQTEANEKFTQMLLTLASGSVADWSGLMQLLTAGGMLGMAGDNIRKNGVIGGLKRNR